MEGKKFETALCELEGIVGKLEGDVPLDEAVAAFERGILLSKICMEELKTEQGKLSLLIDELNKVTKDFKIE